MSNGREAFTYLVELQDGAEHLIRAEQVHRGPTQWVFIHSGRTIAEFDLLAVSRVFVRPGSATRHDWTAVCREVGPHSGR